MKNLLQAIENMNDADLANYIFENKDDYQGATGGLYFTIEDLSFTVKFDNNDIIEYLDLDENADPEEVLKAYEDHEEEIDRHFLLEQIEEVRAELEEQIEIA